MPYTELFKRIKELESELEEKNIKIEEGKNHIRSLLRWPDFHKALLAAGAAQQIADAQFYLSDLKKIKY